jgi:predicted ATPase/DNA-binding SARP family transcriptional activator
VDSPWLIQLLGGLCAERDDRVIRRFRTQKTAALFAYLAYHGAISHPREVLTQIFWPDDDPDAGRHKLRMALSSLRRQLEPPGVPAGAVIAADRAGVQLNPIACVTDVAAFQAALRAATRCRSDAERARLHAEAVERYRGELLPGSCDDWALLERERLAEAYFQAVCRLVAHLGERGDIPRALTYLRRAVAVDPLREEAHAELIRLLADTGQTAAALQQYRELERVLRERLGVAPSPSTRVLTQHLQTGQAPKVALRPSAGSRSCVTRLPLPSALPTGLVAFLMAEVEDGTTSGRPEQETEAAALALHRELMSQEVVRHRGHVAQEGDRSLLAAFARVSDALLCAVAAQRAWHAAAASGQTPEEGEATPAPSPVSIRMALHAGEAEIEDGAYRGLALDHTVAILLAAHGGQILCSEPAAALLRGDREPGKRGFELVELGDYRVRSGTAGPGTPERLFQVIRPDTARQEFPSPRAEPLLAGRLPLQFTRFFGREAEIARLEEMLLGEWGRLITLTGPGGSGKTRLALEAARRLFEAFREAVWFVPLADLADPQRIPDAIRDALHLPGSPHAEPLDQVAQALTDQPALLLLDNFEHLVAEGALIVRDLLERVPRLRCLVTSRQRLDLAGEREVVVPPMAIPEAAATPERLACCESVQLFVDRAQAARPDFQVTRANAGAVAELCRRLEGIPLAIELAAARALVMTPSQILARLEQRLDFLESRRRDAVSRHRSLRAAIEWSYQLLAPELQRFFARLSVFRGGWTLAAAAVCAVGAADPAAASLECLMALRQSSLAIVEEAGDELRYRCLETLREYGSEQLESHGETETARRRHLEYYTSLAEEAEPHLNGPEQQAWLDRLQREHENFRAALTWAAAAAVPPDGRATAEAGMRLAAALGWFWLVRGHLGEGLRHLRALLGLETAQGPTLARARALTTAGRVASWHGDAETTAFLRESVAIWQALGDRSGMAVPLNELGHVALNGGEYECAWHLFDQTRTICEELGDPRGVAIAQANLGSVAYWRADLATAIRLHEASLATMRALGDQWSVGYALERLGLTALDQRDYRLAQQRYAESLRLYHELQGMSGIATCLKGLAVVAAAGGDPERAALLFGAAVTALEPTGQGFLYEPDHPFYARDPGSQLVHPLRTAYPQAWTEGRALTLDQAVAIALGSSAG